MPKSLVKSNGYKILLNKVRKTLIDGQRRIEQERVRTYWPTGSLREETGRVIRADILKHKDRAEYGAEVLNHLADDLDIKVRLLQYCVQFAKVYPQLPIVHRGAQFNWSHYRKFVTVSDDRERSLLEKEALENDWSAQELAARIKKERPVLSIDGDKPVVQLKFTRGRLHTCGIVPAPRNLKDSRIRYPKFRKISGTNKTLSPRGPLALDFGYFGFREQYEIPKDAPKLKENDTVELVFSAKGGSASGGKGGALTGVRGVEAPEEELFTYKAGVERIIDGDTLLVSFDFRYYSGHPRRAPILAQMSHRRAYQIGLQTRSFLPTVERT